MDTSHREKGRQPPTIKRFLRYICKTIKREQMEKKQTLTLLIDDSKVKILKEFLKTLDYVNIQTENEESTDEVDSRLIKGSFKKGEKPSDFGGIWTGEKRDLKKLREKAWRTKR